MPPRHRAAWTRTPGWSRPAQSHGGRNGRGPVELLSAAESAPVRANCRYHKVSFISSILPLCSTSPGRADSTRTWSIGCVVSASIASDVAHNVDRRGLSPVFVIYCSDGHTIGRISGRELRRQALPPWFQRRFAVKSTHARVKRSRKHGEQSEKKSACRKLRAIASLLRGCPENRQIQTGNNGKRTDGNPLQGQQTLFFQPPEVRAPERSNWPERTGRNRADEHRVAQAAGH